MHASPVFRISERLGYFAFGIIRQQFVAATKSVPAVFYSSVLRFKVKETTQRSVLCHLSPRCPGVKGDVFSSSFFVFFIEKVRL